MGTNKRFYEAKASRGQLGETKKGDPEVVVLFNVLTEGATHQQLTWHGYFTEKTTDRTVESLRIAGYKGDNLEDFAEGLDFPADAPTVQLVVEDEKYEGKTYAKVQWVNRLGGLSVKQAMAPDKAKAAAAQMRAAFRAHDAAKGVKATPPPKAAPKSSGTVPDADIPF